MKGKCCPLSGMTGKNWKIGEEGVARMCLNAFTCSLEAERKDRRWAAKQRVLGKNGHNLNAKCWSDAREDERKPLRRGENTIQGLMQSRRSLANKESHPRDTKP